MGRYLRKAVSGASSIFAFGVGAAAVNYIIRLVLARNLSAEGYGLFFAVLSFVMFFASLRELGIPHALAQHISHLKAKKEYGKCKSAFLAAATIQITVSILLAVTFFVMSDYLSTSYFKHPQSKTLLILVTAYMLISVFFVLIRSVLLGSHKLFLYGSFDFVRNILFLLFIMIFLKLSFGVITPGAAYIVAAFFLVSFYSPAIVLFWRKLPGNLEKFRETTKKISSFGIYAFGGDFSVRVIRYFDTMVLTAFWTLKDVGIYNVVVPTCMLFALFGKSIGNAVMPLSADMNARKDHYIIRRMISMLHSHISLIAIPLSIAFAYASEILTFLYGREYSAGAVSFRILMVGISFYAVTQINNSVLIGIGNPKKVASTFAIAAISNGALNLILIPSMGINGAAIATSFSYLLAFVLSLRSLRKEMGFYIGLKRWAIVILLASAMVVISLGMKARITMGLFQEMAVVLIAVAFLHVLLGWLFGIFNLSEILVYVRKLRRKEQ